MGVGNQKDTDPQPLSWTVRPEGVNVMHRDDLRPLQRVILGLGAKNPNWSVEI